MQPRLAASSGQKISDFMADPATRS